MTLVRSSGREGVGEWTRGRSGNGLKGITNKTRANG